MTTLAAHLLLAAALAGDTADRGCTRMWTVRVLFQEPIFSGPDAARGWAWRALETAPVVERSEAEETRAAIQANGYTPQNPFCPDPAECSEDWHATPASIRFATIKQLCCLIPNPGPQHWPCVYVDTLPPPAP